MRRKPFHAIFAPSVSRHAALRSSRSVSKSASKAPPRAPMPRDSSCLHRGSALLAAFIQRCRDIISARRASKTYPSAAAPNAPSSTRRKDALFPALSQRCFSAERSSAFRRAAAVLAVALSARRASKTHPSAAAPNAPSSIRRKGTLFPAFSQRCFSADRSSVFRRAISAPTIALSARRASGTHPIAAAPNAPSSPRRKDALFPAFSQCCFSADRSSAFRRTAAALAVTLLTALPAPAEEDDFAGVLAIVNGQALPSAEAQAQFDDYAPFFVSFGQGDALDALRREIARAAVRRALILDDCRRLGIEADEHDLAELRAQADADYAVMLKAQCDIQPGADAGVRLAAAEEALAKSNITAASLYARTLDDLLIARHYAFVTDGVSIDESELRDAYIERCAAQRAAYAQCPALFERAMLAGEIVCFVPQGARRIRHMLILADPDDQAALSELLARKADANAAETDALIAEQAAPLLERADMLRKRLDAGESFASLMAEYRDDARIRPSPFTGGEYGYVAQSGCLWDDALRAAALALAEPGDVSAPVITPLGVHLLQHAGDMTEGAVDFESVRARLEEELIDQAKKRAYEARIAALFDMADIIWYDDRLSYPEP